MSSISTPGVSRSSPTEIAFTITKSLYASGSRRTRSMPSIQLRVEGCRVSHTRAPSAAARMGPVFPCV